jgi:hypothetical protein
MPLYIAGMRMEPATSEPTPITDAAAPINAAFKKINVQELFDCYFSGTFFLYELILSYTVNSIFHLLLF